MDVLKPWLAATIEGELGEALRHREDGTNRHQLTGAFRALSYDDGSNLRISSAKKGPVVQITKFLTFEEPIQVTLSDSVIRVNASITNQASQQYAKQNRRKLTEGTVGGLIQLHDFEIVATHLGPRDKRLTLYVKDFKSIGSSGSGSFGVAPQAIESREGTKELLNKLADLRKYRWDAHSEQSATVSPIRSRPSTQTSEAGSNQDTQVGFATQVPRSKAPIVSKPKPQYSTTSTNSGSTSTAVRSLAPLTKGKHGNPSAGTLSSLQVQAAPQRPSVNEALLGLLRNCKGVPPAPEIISEPTTEQPPGRTGASIGPAVIEYVREASRDRNLAPGNHNARGVIGTSKRKRQSPDNTPRKKAADDLDFHGIDKDSESLAVNHDLDNNARSGAAVAEASINTLHSRPASPSILGSARLHPNVPLESSISNFTSSAPSQNTGRSRISSRDVKIPKDQEALLNRGDSWLPAEPGQCEPTANIPISLLQTLNRKADLSAQRPTHLRKQRYGTMSSSAVIDQTADSESDVPVSSGQWPASPEHDQLPPDSSPVNAEHSDHSVLRALKNPRSVSSSRKQSNASISSHSMPSRRPSPISARRFSRESGSSSMVSPGLLSSSVASTSAGEEVHRFKCQAPGCDKSYKKSAGLKYHVDRHHPSTGSFENFKCPAKDCTKSYASPGGLKYHIDRHHNGNTAPPSHSGSATPTIPGASTPIFPLLKSSSERNGGSGRKVVDSGADNASASAEVSASISPLLDRGSRNPTDEEVVRRLLSTSSVLKSNSLPDAQLALIQPASRTLDGTHIAKEPFSRLLPASPTPESDLELTVPLPLNDKTGSIASSAPMQQFPSTASQPQDPFTQVKCTPYINGHVQNKSLSGSRILSSPLKANINPLMNGTINEFVSASVASGLETSIAESHGENGSSITVDDQGVGNVAASLPKESNSQNLTDSNLEKSDRLIAEVHQESRKADVSADKPDDSSHIMTEIQRQGSGLDRLSVAANAKAKIKSRPEQLPTPEDNHTDPLIQLPTSDHAAQIAHDMKRKVTDSSFESPSLAKRQKRFKVPSAFTFTERSEVPRDPSKGARQYRQDFLASRRSSESSTPTMSPTTPFTVFAGPTAENPRDPAERARQIRQEFLASRRSSESSTPTTSPRMQFTALMGTIQAERRNAEVEINVEKVTVQNQSVDTEIERQKTELKELTAKPQLQEVELDAASLPNGTAYIEPDGGNAKPGAQDNPSFDDEAEYRLFVAQNADVEGLEAEQSIVVQENSYASDDEAQRAQSVELDVSFQSFDHQKGDNDLVNANDDADRTVDPEIDLMVAGNDQLANTTEEGRSVDPKLGKANKDLFTRVDEVVEEGSSPPTSEMTLNQAAEPDTTALEPLHQQPSIEENSDTHTPDKTASKPTPQQQLDTVDADTPLPDKIAAEPMSQQRLIGVQIDIPMPEVKVDRDITPLGPVAHTGEPMNQTTPLSIAVPAFIAESNPEHQRRLSPAVVKPAIPLSNPASISEVKPVEAHLNAVQLPNETIRQDSPSVPQNIFEKFKATYPAYPGDIKHFAAMCRKISQLVRANGMAHQSLWDDFIVRHKIEYSKYLQKCAEEAEDVVPYEDFYQTEIEEPQYQKRVINRRNLDEALALVAQKPVIEQVHVEPSKDDEPCVEPVEHRSTTYIDPVLGKMHNEYSAANGDERLEPVGTISAIKPAIPYEIVRKPSESRVTIDLTEDDPPDDPPDDQPKKTKEREIPPQSSIPHLVNGLSVEQPPVQYRGDSSGNLYQVPYTSSAMRDSHVPAPPQSMRSPPMPATAATKSTSKILRRSLPWKESDHSVLQSSPRATASNSPKRFSGSEVREVRAKGSSNARLQVSENSTSNSAKQSQGLLNTCLRVIQSNWGIEAHELLEPEYYREQVLSETMIELLAEIASKINVSKARYRINEAIESRIRVNARRGAGHPSRDRKMLKSDLEVVRGVAETSSMSTMCPFSLPHTNAAVEKQDEGTPSKWWDDDNSPFKSFARAYASIRHGNGNSFAKVDAAGPEDAEKVHGAANGGVQLKKIDVMRWNL